MTELIIVVKLGGTEGVDFSAICADAAELLAQGQKLVFVHGGSAEVGHAADIRYLAVRIHIPLYQP